MAAVDFLASRGMGKPGSPRGSPRGVEAQGKKVVPSAVASQAIEAQPSFGQIKPWRGRVVRTPNSILRRRRGGRRMCCTRGPDFQAKKREPWRSERPTTRPGNPCGRRHCGWNVSLSAWRCRPTRALKRRPWHSRSRGRASFTAPKFNLFDDEDDAASPVPGRAHQWKRCRTSCAPPIDIRRDKQRHSRPGRAADKESADNREDLAPSC